MRNLRSGKNVVKVCKKKGCQKQFEGRIQCKVCKDFVLCLKCFEENGHHEHDSWEWLSKSNPASDGVKQIETMRCIRTLRHAVQCKSANCELTPCLKMKLVLAHSENCKAKETGNCPICHQVYVLCGYHANYCMDKKCLVPNCSTIKENQTQGFSKSVQRANQESRNAFALGQLSAATISVTVGPGAVVDISRSPQGAKETITTLKESLIRAQLKIDDLENEKVKMAKYWEEKLRRAEMKIKYLTGITSIGAETDDVKTKSRKRLFEQMTTFDETDFEKSYEPVELLRDITGNLKILTAIEIKRRRVEDGHIVQPARSASQQFSYYS